MIAAILARNEADRYLRETLESLRPLCDDILLLDDNSTDDTRDIAWQLGCTVRIRQLPPMWGQESSARQELWNWGAEVCGDGWLYISDADHVTVADPAEWKALQTSWNVNAWALPLYDCWDSPETFRADGYWQGYRTARPWLFKPSTIERFAWNTRGIHCGHAPIANWVTGVAPPSIFIKHMGWLRPEDRTTKHSRYAAESGSLQPDELAHLNTVLE